ncbi:MAG: hypothetical protein HW391_197 [Chloroflexi bacterium]|nr:hypothetical protein [Chloroflexota bacterium]
MNRALGILRSVRLRRQPSIFASVMVAAILGATPALADQADPLLGGKPWAQDQAVGYAWRSGQVPPAWMAVAIDTAAADANATRASRAAVFVRMTGGTSLVAYGEPTGCSTAGIACYNRSGAPSSFRMWFRAHGYIFDWGTLRWCQGLAVIANGCFDAENVALDEFGHVQILEHHVNEADGSDYLDAVVQTVSRARPAIGWNVHALGRCDTARLQLEYDRAAPRDPFSTCLAIETATTLKSSSTSVSIGATVQFTATLRTTGATLNRALANDPVSARTITLQRRTNSGQAWSSIGTMVPSNSIEGTYAFTTSPTATYEWRAVFTPAAGDGAVASFSTIVKITVSGCSGSGCPSGTLP